MILTFLALGIIIIVLYAAGVGLIASILLLLTAIYLLYCFIKYGFKGMKLSKEERIEIKRRLKETKGDAKAREKLYKEYNVK